MVPLEVSPCSRTLEMILVITDLTETGEWDQKRPPGGSELRDVPLVHVCLFVPVLMSLDQFKLHLHPHLHLPLRLPLTPPNCRSDAAEAPPASRCESRAACQERRGA